MINNENELKENVSKSAFLIGLLIEISVCLVGFLLQAVLIEVGLKYFCYIIFGIVCIYFIGRNYFFPSFSSAILGIRWVKSKLIPLKNIIYLSIILAVLMVKPLFIKIILGLAINFDMFLMFLKGEWFLDKCFKIETYKNRK